MSVIMALRLKGDPAKFEEFAKAHPEMAEIKDDAVEHGVIAHRFFGSLDGSEVIVVDEWPDAESFQTFFEKNQERVGQLMSGAGAEPAGPPEFWRVLDTPDKHGWDNAV
jgi:heme-degrading monooxygenase HmoA